MQWARVSPSWSILGPLTSEMTREADWSVVNTASDWSGGLNTASDWSGGLNKVSDWLLTGPGEHVEDARGAEDEVHVTPLAGHEALDLALLEDIGDLLGVIPGLGGGGGGKGTV
mgnify:CR=1 FL=1